jgi:hypothetical protein
LRCVCRKAWRFKSSPAHKNIPVYTGMFLIYKAGLF